MAPIPDQDPDYASKVASRQLEAADAASPAGGQQADRQSDEHATDSTVHSATEGTLGDIEEIAPSAGAILDEEIILADAIAGAISCCRAPLQMIYYSLSPLACCHRLRTSCPGS